ncbi:cysteine hydrolase family protein [Thalassospira sp. CH_XMU1448-2]|uniref:cysteine hydrolase family protein n=1 Tax=Thalassospira sp. CH_XMU1448-2 TaxID=3107773 RepID=UPI00300823FC
MNKTALILIDWQQGFDDLDYWGNRNNPDAERNGEKLLTHWRKAGQPVFHVKHDSTEPQSRLHPDHQGNAIKQALAPIEGEPVYGKNVNSAFIGTSLEADLRAQGISRLVLCGITTDHCVNTSTRMAGNLGFEVTIASDACATFDRSLPDGRVFPAELVHDVALSSLNGEFAAVKTVEQIIGSPSQV